MNSLMQHLPVMPIILPLLAGAAMLLLQESQRSARVTIALTSAFAQLTAAIALLYFTTDAAPQVWPEGIGVYSIGGWAAPFGIVLVVDRLSALMVALGTTVAVATLVYSIARWDRPGQPFHSVFQFLMMGVNGAFLTGDLFNLFVFFEILLAASYALLLRGVGTRRVRRGLHYIAVNLASTFLFLIGVALIYGVAGTLNMADLTGKVAELSPADRSLFDTGAAILGVAFLVKAGSWPLNFWLPRAYPIAIAPVSAAFGIMTKVGIYAVLRVGTLMGDDDVAAALLGACIGFLWWNASPAKIFMGDSGSYFLGFALATVSLAGSQKASTAISLLVPVLALGHDGRGVGGVGQRNHTRPADRPRPDTPPPKPPTAQFLPTAPTCAVRPRGCSATRPTG